MLDPSDAPTMRSRARVGNVLRDKWRLEALLGVGGMASVYAATHVNNGRRGAIKLLHPELSMNMEVRNRFLREGYAANKVAHPGTVAVLDDDVAEDGSVFLVMELLEGESLGERRDRVGSIPAADVLQIADKILDVLVCAHDKGIVHRDLKPDNVFLCRSGAVKLLDFGIARVREASGAWQTMTNAGAMGTPAFMPPEQARGRSSEVGPQTDLWALGATMYTLLTGRLVHEAETLNELLLAAMTKPAPPLATMLPRVAPGVAFVVDRALAYAPADRWADARAMQSAVRGALHGLAVDAARVSAPALSLGATTPMVVAARPTAGYPPFGPGAAPPPSFLPLAAATAVSPSFSAMAASASVPPGHAVTIGPGGPLSGAPAAAKSKVGWIVAALAAVTLLGGLGVWAAIRRTPAVAVAEVTPSPGPTIAVEIASTNSAPAAAAPPSVEPRPESSAPPAVAAPPSVEPRTELSASPPDPKLAPSASAASLPRAPGAVKLTGRLPTAPAAPPKARSEQDLLNRRH